jgi:LysM repeat protein
MLSRRLFAVLIMTVAFMAVLPLAGALAFSGEAADTPQPKPEVVGPNLLTNPGMDGAYVKQCSLRYGPPWVQVPCPADYSAQAGDIKKWETTQVPSGWSAWWRQPNSNFDDPNYYNDWPAYCSASHKSMPLDCIAHHNPEYRDTMGGPQDTGPSRKVAGDNSQKYFTFYSIHEAGLYQVVSGVKPGDRLRFSVYMEGWSTGVNDPYHSDFNQHMNLQVGIDPTGGNDPWSSNIVWTAPAESFDKFTQFFVEAVARNNIVSVWTKSAPVLALQHVDVYVDEASLNVVQPGTVVVPVRSTRVVTSTRIITSTRQMTDTYGIIYNAVFTQTVIFTRTVSVGTSTQLVTTNSINGTGPVTPSTSVKPVSGTLPIPASGTYTVVRGDTLIAIARRFGILPWRRLVDLNSLQNPNRIEPGLVLVLQ